MTMHRRTGSNRVPALAIAAMLLGGFTLAHAGDVAGKDGTSRDAGRLKFFEQEVRPLLVEHCYSCHGSEKQKGDLRLDSMEAILKGGETGPAVVPGKPEESLLVEAIHYDGLEMPPSGRLESSEVDVLTRWIALGAPWPAATGKPEAHAVAATPGTSKPAASDPNLWSLKPLRSPDEAWKAVEAVLSTGSAWGHWVDNPIDAFVLDGLLEKGLSPAPEADKRTLIRRLSFDLTGLPPTPADVDGFLADESPRAYERLVDRLLASPLYGQRWGRHWLDLVRYAESDGYRQDAYRPAAWRYRDYVVRSLNADKPYDRFLTEQIAGDELDPEDLELRVATGFLRLGTYEFNQRNVAGQWSDILNDITDVTGEAFLGLSVGCARCHDHKFDPILQKDYYRLQAFFTPLLPRDDLALASSKQCAEFQSSQAAWEQATAEIRGEIAALEKSHRDAAAQGAVDKFPPEIKAILGKPEKDRSPLETQLAALAERQVVLERDKEPVLKGKEKTRRDELKRRLAAFDRLRPSPLPEVMTAVDVGPVSPPTVIPGTRRSGEIEPGFLTALDASPAKAAALPPEIARISTGRRLALAQWLCRPDHPLTTRVIVNRVWQHHFGKGLVATSSDFGRLGEAPSHPELLDWLARRFVADGWKLKSLHRLILTSAAYRQSSERSESEVETALRIDPENRLLWMHSVRRLDAEEIRDAMLAVSGELRAGVGGPSAEAAEPRRSVETKLMRNSKDPLLDVFDAPDGYASAGRRVNTTTSTQALLLVNGSWVLGRARALADRLERSAPEACPDRRALQVETAFRQAFGRPPEADEKDEATAFLGSQTGRVQGPSGRRDHEALVDLCHALLNSNEFLYVD